MAAHLFTSESYVEGQRFGAWQEAIAALGLQASGRIGQRDTHATAVMRGSRSGVRVARLAAGAQTLLPGDGAGAMALLIRAEAGAALSDSAEAATAVGPGALVLLPQGARWTMRWPQGLRASALSIHPDAFRGRRIDYRSDGCARVLGSGGLPAILSEMLRSVAERLDGLTAADWAAIEAGVSELTLAVLSQLAPAAGDTGTAQAALLYRLHRAIETGLADPALSPARVAEAEGISERYLQKVFEGAGDSFSHYLRERRLQRAATDLANPAEAASTVSEIAFRSGFNDAAHFSRTFRERFAMSPRDFRQQEAERLRAVAGARGQRGWPQDRPATERASGDRGQPRPAETAAPRLRPVAASAQHHLPVGADRVHWGFFSRSLAPQIVVDSGDVITVETLTQHASDDPARMIDGDAGAESVFRWTAHEKAVGRRGAGPMDGSIYGRGAGEGFGVHICTGPIAVRDAQLGDVLEVRILDIVPRPSGAPGLKGRSFGSSVAAWWGYHYGELVTEPKPREVVTIYEIHADDPEPYASALYSYRWTPQTDPFGTVHRTYDYPGVPVDPATVLRREEPLAGIRIPLRPHFGVVAVAPREADLIDSVPPAYFGGNLDNWRLGKGAAVYLPVSVPGALLSIGDPHAAQGDGELGGTAIECSMTGTIQVRLHKKVAITDGVLSDLSYPLIETEHDWVLTGFSHPNYLAEFGPKGQGEVYAKSSLDLAMKDAFRKARRFLMRAGGLTEDEAVALMSAGVDFGITQVVDGNWGVHAIIPKHLCAARPS